MNAARCPFDPLRSYAAAGLALLFLAGLSADAQEPQEAAPDMSYFVRVSPRDHRYFELSNGKPFIPIGLNMIAPPGGDEQEALATMEGWMKNLADNDGNFIRLWLSNPFFDVEHKTSGVYDEQKAQRIDQVLEMARRHGIRVKMTIEHFRHFFQNRRQWAAKPIHHVSKGGPAWDVEDFFKGAASREQFKKKLDWYRQRYGDDPVIFAWELWNEVDTVLAKSYMEWTEEMLSELKKRFPKNLATQSLGSFDNWDKLERYDRLSVMANNDFAQVHRYLDLGASLEVCGGPVDDLVIDAICTLEEFEADKPIILAESGAVEPRHSGPFKLYGKDKAGIILHDVIFAPYFAGAAGTGQIWHWDRYVAKQNLWFQFARFAEVVKDLDPPAQDFEPVEIFHNRLRVMALRGKTVFLAWCRDKQNHWQSELAQGKAPETIHSAQFYLPYLGKHMSGTPVRFYDPWLNRWSEGVTNSHRVTLPDFKRSVVVRLDYEEFIPPDQAERQRLRGQYLPGRKSLTNQSP